MKKLNRVFATTLAVVLVAGIAQATPMLNIDSFASDSGDGYTISLDTGNLDNTFGTIIVEVLPDSPANFLNFNPTGTAGFTPLPPGEDQSYTNALLAAPVAFGGFGYSVIDGGTQNVDSSGPAGIGYNAGPLGENITSQEPIFLNNVILPTGTTGSVSVQLVDTGNVLQTLSSPLPVPEPGTLVLAALGILGVAFGRHRK